MDDAFARARMSHQPFLVTNSLLFLKSLVKQGGAVTFLPTYAVRTDVQRSELIAIPTDSAILNSAHLDLCIHASRRLSSAAAEFVLLVQEELRKLRSDADQRCLIGNSPWQKNLLTQHRDASIINWTG